VRTAQQILGHSSAQTTLVYLRSVGGRVSAECDCATRKNNVPKFEKNSEIQKPVTDQEEEHPFSLSARICRPSWGRNIEGPLVS
jgi:hypothetical protein